MENDNKFSYTYSAPTEAERREIEGIRRQYKAEDENENKIERLRKLHSAVVGRATAVSLVFGVLGVLVFGGGMALALELEMIALGIILASIGAVPMAFAYPMYKSEIARGKKKYGEEIIRLSDEILSQGK